MAIDVLVAAVEDLPHHGGIAAERLGDHRLPGQRPVLEQKVGALGQFRHEPLVAQQHDDAVLAVGAQGVVALPGCCPSADGKLP